MFRFLFLSFNFVEGIFIWVEKIWKSHTHAHRKIRCCLRAVVKYFLFCFEKFNQWFWCDLRCGAGMGWYRTLFILDRTGTGFNLIFYFYIGSQSRIKLCTSWEFFFCLSLLLRVSKFKGFILLTWHTKKQNEIKNLRVNHLHKCAECVRM